MSQADLNVANQSGAAFRADLNTQLLALGTLQSGASEPGTTYAYMLWADSANGLLKQRNAANNGWVSLGSLVTTNLGMLPIAGGTMTGALGVTAGTVSAPGVFFSDDTNTGVYSPNADALALATAGTNRLHITSAGLVGIGTTGPTTKLHVQDSGICYLNVNGQSANFYISSGSSGGGFFTDTALPITFGINSLEKARIDSSGRLLVGTSSTSASSRLVVQGNSAGAGSSALQHMCFDGATPADGDGLGYFIFGDNTQAQGAFIFGVRDGGTWSGSSKPTRLVFSTTADGASSPTEHLRITNPGYVAAYCNNIAGGYVHYMASAVGASSASYLIVGTYGATGVLTGTTSFIVSTNGNVLNTNNSYAGISDLKLKENIINSGSQWNDIKALQVRKYNFKEGQTHTQIGLVAQEVELVSPGLVTESPDRDDEGNDLGTVTKSVNYSVLYMKAVKALQEAMERIEALEADVAQLKGA